MSTKQQIFLRDIIFKKLPGIVNDILMQECILKLTELYPTSIDVENLVEHSLAFKGGYDFIDESEKDFNDIDESDSKTVSINPKTGKAEIIGLENKVGSIRITIYNPISPEATSYLYIPRDHLPHLVRECYGTNAGKKRLTITWSKKRPKKYKDPKIGYFNMYEKFRLDTFDELAEITDEKFYQLNPTLRLNISLPIPDSSQPAKTDPTPQTPIPCTLVLVQQQNLDFEDTLPIYPYEIS
jgi:hypothetical protein